MRSITVSKSSVDCKSYKLRQSKNCNRRLSVAKWRLRLRLSCEYGTNPGGLRGILRVSLLISVCILCDRCETWAWSRTGVESAHRERRKRANESGEERHGRP